MRAALAVALLALLCAAAAVQARLLPWGHHDEDEKAAETVLFSLYTQDNPNDADAESLSVADIRDGASFQRFNPRRPTKILVHGWRGSVWRTAELKDALLGKHDLNVILVNWRAVDTIVYPVAAARVKVVAVQLAHVVQHLVDKQGLEGRDLHLVGHSLGAHTAGLASLHLREDTVIARITGLDPAGPLFKDGRTNRLDASHADFVDVIHTCANVFGYRDAIGHVDFYPNGGTAFQPGCLVPDLTTGKCSHNRAYLLFNESILLNSTFLAYRGRDADHPCEDVDTDGEPVVMGLDTPTRSYLMRSARGVYCLSTRPESPFGYGEDMPPATPSEPSLFQKAVMKYLFRHF
ncbi:hypothetical protein ONE63_004752 [Megalurothrips usitatus]|uniref:Lipase domain-containing protein n=1 Tax=Megalurothrips usitatus TaxID=439358 RepID=A0AAV7X4P3_9NEOP|nr:hypothetical protein ONE63_004752 [Megalurothrips usitatus]